MTNAHISNEGGVSLTRAQQRHLEMIKPLLAEVSVSETARIQTAQDTVRWRTEDFTDIVAVWARNSGTCQIGPEPNR